jgi:ketosteroid isomerase-like protein
MGNTVNFRIALLATVLAAFAVVADGQQKPAGGKPVNPQSLEQTLMDLQRQEDESEAKQDVAALDRLFADDAILSLNKVLTKSEFITLVKDAKNAPSAPPVVKYDEILVRDLGNAAAVNYRVTFQTKDSAGKEETGRFRALVVWVKQGNQWRIAAAQTLPLP